MIVDKNGLVYYRGFVIQHQDNHSYVYRNKSDYNKGNFLASFPFSDGSLWKAYDFIDEYIKEESRNAL